MPEQAPAVDQAHPILAGEPTISDDQRADLWDIFHGSKDSNELASRLQPLDVHPDLKNQLVGAKKQSEAGKAPIDRVTEAISRIKGMDRDTLELAESHPKVTAALVSAAEKASEKETETKESKKGAKGEKKPAQHLQQPPRADGLEHLPPIQDGHYRVQASDGGIHDIPQENIEQAREIDPNLHVMNP